MKHDTNKQRAGLVRLQLSCNDESLCISIPQYKRKDRGIDLEAQIFSSLPFSLSKRLSERETPTHLTLGVYAIHVYSRFRKVLSRLHLRSKYVSCFLVYRLHHTDMVLAFKNSLEILW